jgi:hypothetical protein
MFSIYTSAFNLIKNKFNYKFHIQNFAQFADEVVIAINTSEDNSVNELRDFVIDNCNNVSILETSFSYDDPLLDGKIKNAALQVTKQDIKIGLDMDEYIPLWQKPLWQNVATQLIYSTYKSVMIPSLNLYKDRNHYFSINPKWYMHTKGFYRGPVNFARKQDGTVDTTKSDTCELIDENGNIPYSIQIPHDINSLRTKNIPFVVHTGYVNLENRLIRNKNFWKEHWKTESGGIEPTHKVHESLEDFKENYQEHNLDI